MASNSNRLVSELREIEKLSKATTEEGKKRTFWEKQDILVSWDAQTPIKTADQALTYMPYAERLKKDASRFLSTAKKKAVQDVCSISESIINNGGKTVSENKGAGLGSMIAENLIMIFIAGNTYNIFKLLGTILWIFEALIFVTSIFNLLSNSKTEGKRISIAQETLGALSSLNVPFNPDEEEDLNLLIIVLNSYSSSDASQQQARLESLCNSTGLSMSNLDMAAELANIIEANYASTVPEAMRYMREEQRHEERIKELQETRRQQEARARQAQERAWEQERERRLQEGLRQSRQQQHNEEMERQARRKADAAKNLERWYAEDHPGPFNGGRRREWDIRDD